MTSHFAGQRAQKLNTAVCQLKLFFHPLFCVRKYRTKKHRQIHTNPSCERQNTHTHTRSHTFTNQQYHRKKNALIHPHLRTIGHTIEKFGVPIIKN